MTFRSLFRITLIGGSLCACVNQYTSPDGEVEKTSKEPPPDNSRLPSESSEAANRSKEAQDSSNEPKSMPDDAKRDPIEGSGTCDDRTCVSATDCCKGYQCGFDPERSKVMRYCLPQ